jgi:hypothetical protein
MTAETSLNKGVAGYTYNSTNGWAWLFEPGYNKVVTPDTKSIVGEIVLFPQSGKTFVAAERAAIFEQWWESNPL